jgi:hypothetical protein
VVYSFSEHAGIYERPFHGLKLGLAVLQTLDWAARGLDTGEDGIPRSDNEYGPAKWSVQYLQRQSDIIPSQRHNDAVQTQTVQTVSCLSGLIRRGCLMYSGQSPSTTPILAVAE